MERPSQRRRTDVGGAVDDQRGTPAGDAICQAANDNAALPTCSGSGSNDASQTPLWPQPSNPCLCRSAHWKNRELGVWDTLIGLLDEAQQQASLHPGERIHQEAVTFYRRMISDHLQTMRDVSPAPKLRLLLLLLQILAQAAKRDDRGRVLQATVAYTMLRCGYPLYVGAVHCLTDALVFVAGLASGRGTPHCA